MTYVKRRKAWRMSCDVGEVTERLENEQPFRHFTYVKTHSPTLPSLYLRHSLFSNPSVASPTSQFILQPLFRFFCDTSSSLKSRGEPPMPATRVSFPAGTDFKFLSWGWVFVLCVVLVFSGGGSDIVLITHSGRLFSVLVHSLLLPSCM